MNNIETTKQPLSEYNSSFTGLLELIWGESLLSPGGSDHVMRMFNGLDLRNKEILDFGCGLGGHAMQLVKKEKCSVLGVDIEKELVDAANARILQYDSLKGSARFELIEADGILGVKDTSLDIVYSKDSILHVKEKQKLFNRIHTALKAEGKIVLHDWFHESEVYRQCMADFLEIDGVSYHLCSIDDYIAMLEGVGFKDIQVLDRSEEVLKYTILDIEQFKNAHKSKIEEEFGNAYYDHTLKSWDLQKEVFEGGDMRAFQVIGTK